jgi:hypothetical protein
MEPIFPLFRLPQFFTARGARFHLPLLAAVEVRQ